MSKSKKNTFIIDIAVLVIVAIVLAITMPFSLSVELALGLAYYVDANGDRVDPSVASAEDSAAELKVHFVNVRQGDCCIIELPDGKTMVIDGGNNKKEHSNLIMTFIDNNLPDLKYFDYAILTHADSDHCGSMDDILNRYPAYTVYRPNVLLKRDDYTDPAADDLLDCYGTAVSVAYRDFLKAAYTPQAAHDFTPNVIVTDATNDAQTITGGAGDDKYTLNFFSPLYSSGKVYADVNNYSPIMLLEYRDFKFVMTGDAEENNETEFVAKVQSAASDGVTDKYDIFDDGFNADVIKAGHHGSKTSSTQGFLDTVTTPDGAASSYYIFSCDRTDGKDYGHPSPEVLDRIANMGVKDDKILRTDKIGDINFSVRQDADGTYKLFYGDTAAQKPAEPDSPEPTEPTEPSTAPEYTLVRVKIGNVEVRWTWLAWVCYAVLVIAVLIHIAVVRSGSSDKRKR